MKFSTTVRNARANVVETTIGASPVLHIYAGAVPADCDAADTGSPLVSINLPADWLGAASNGVVDMAGSWSGTVATSGTASHFRIKAGGTTTHLQGTITAPGGGGDLIMASLTLTELTTIPVTLFRLTEGNA